MNNEESPVRNGDSNHSPKGPSLSERAKVVEEKSDVVDEGLETEGPERGASHRTSIAGNLKNNLPRLLKISVLIFF